MQTPIPSSTGCPPRPASPPRHPPGPGARRRRGPFKSPVPPAAVAAGAAAAAADNKMAAAGPAGPESRVLGYTLHRWSSFSSTYLPE